MNKWVVRVNEREFVCILPMDCMLPKSGTIDFLHVMRDTVSGKMANAWIVRHTQRPVVMFDARQDAEFMVEFAKNFTVDTHTWQIVAI